MWRSVVLVTLFLGALLPEVRAQFRTVRTEDFKLLYYDFGHEYLVGHTLRSYTNALRFHEKMFGYRLSEPVVIVMEDFGDYGNAGASAVPRNVVLMGIAPFKHAYETNTTNERINVLANHELVHIVALDMASKSDRLFRKFLGGKIDAHQSDPVSIFYGYLTAPRRYSPRWYHEGIAEFMTTWMSGGIGRVMGTYDEMRFRAMVRDGDYIYDAVGLESEGTTVDFEVGANSYMYGTRFMSYLALQYGPRSLVEWTARTDSSRRYYAGQFKKVYGRSLDDEWHRWVRWETDWQNANLERIRKNAVTQGRPMSSKPLGGVSRAVVDPFNGRIYAAIAYPGQVAHIAELDPVKGTTRRIVDVEGSALHFVSSVAYDPQRRVLFYTNDNNKWRDLMAVDLNDGRVQRLMKDARVGDLVFNRADGVLWGVRHLNGIASIVRIPPPYDDWKLVHPMPYGQDLFDIDLSPDGKRLTAAVSDIAGDQRLILLSTDSLLAGKFQPDVLGEFAENTPANFVFSPDGSYLVGSTYYTGVSNIVRFDLETRKLEWLSNAETGLFKPIPLESDSLIAFEYFSRGFLPVKISTKPLTHVSAVEFLGNAIAEQHPEVTRWAAPLPPPSALPLDSLIIERGEYRPPREMGLTGSYPIIQGYKDHVVLGMRLDFADAVRFQRLNLTLGWSPAPSLAPAERFHGSFLYGGIMWSWHGSYNAADFYDLFGPTKTSRKGYSLGTSHRRTLRYELPRVTEFNSSLTYYGGLERLPQFQNVTTSYSRFVGLSASYKHRNILSSLGAVDPEKGLIWELGGYANTVLEGMDENRIFFPRIFHNFDYGFALPMKHASVWLRSSVGYSFSPKAEPLGNFYLGGFGNNWIDHQESRRYRGQASFPGVALNEVGGTNYAKMTAEWVLPPVRFKRLGFMGLYSNWAQWSLFGSGLATNIGSPILKTSPVTGGEVTAAPSMHSQRRLANAGTQVDMKLVMFSVLDATLSAGYASAWDLDGLRPRGNEWMLSLKILR